MTARSIRTYADLADAPASGVPEQIDAQFERLRARLARVRSIVAIASGKGGVGKSFVTAQLAARLAARGLRTGALDADVHGPSLAAMLGASRRPLRVTDDGITPAHGAGGSQVMSTDLLLASPDVPVRWREPAIGGFVWQSALETAVFREFLADVAWGELDFLLVDLPPGTDKIVRALTLLPATAAFLMVTTPSRMAGAVVRRSLTQAREARTGALGVVVNMAGLTCAACGAAQPLFPGEDGALPEDAEVWAAVPFDRALADATDAGAPLRPGAARAAGQALDGLADRLIREVAGLGAQGSP